MRVPARDAAPTPPRASTAARREAEQKRDALANGGEHYLITRVRESLHPNGFSYVLPSSSYTHSPTDAQLAAAANWRLVGDPKGIAMARIITNG